MTFTLEKSTEGSNLKWPSTTITWSVATADYPADDKTIPFNINDTVSFSALPGLIQKSVAAWAAVSDLKFVRVPDSPTADIRIGLGTIPSPALATTTYHYSYPPGRFKPDTTIVLEDPADHPLTSDLVYGNTTATMQQVLTREIGHALGLGDDTSDQSAVMWKDGLATNRKLDIDDIAAIRALYGGHPGAGVPPSRTPTPSPKAATAAIDPAALQIATKPDFLLAQQAPTPPPITTTAGAIALAADLTPPLPPTGKALPSDVLGGGWDTGFPAAALLLHSLG